MKETSGVKAKKLITQKQAEEAIEALRRIASYGDGLQPHIIDWERLGKSAKDVAKDFFRPKCKECGRGR